MMQVITYNQTIANSQNPGAIIFGATIDLPSDTTQVVILNNTVVPEYFAWGTQNSPTNFQTPSAPSFLVNPGHSAYVRVPPDALSTTGAQPVVLWLTIANNPLPIDMYATFIVGNDTDYLPTYAGTDRLAVNDFNKPYTPTLPYAASSFIQGFGSASGFVVGNTMSGFNLLGNITIYGFTIFPSGNATGLSSLSISLVETGSSSGQHISTFWEGLCSIVVAGAYIPYTITLAAPLFIPTLIAVTEFLSTYTFGVSRTLVSGTIPGVYLTVWYTIQ